MDRILKKIEIKAAIDKTEDERRRDESACGLNLHHSVGITELHQIIIQERMQKYCKDESELKDWDDVQQTL